MKNLYKILALFFLAIPVYSQEICFTQVSDEQKAWETSVTIPNDYQEKVNKTFEITVWVRASDFTVQSYFENELEKAKKYFEPIGVNFKACDFNLIEDPNYKDVKPYSDLEEEMLTLFYKKQTINIYLSEYSGASLNTYGFSHFPGDSIDAVFLNIMKFDYYTITHQLGHLFGLYHTHEVAYGGEYVNGSNCKTKGDRVCDTPAEPNLYYSVNSECKYTGSNKDANDDYYIPSVANLMNLTIEKCGCIFTKGQYKRMAYILNNYKSHLR